MCQDLLEPFSKKTLLAHYCPKLLENNLQLKCGFVSHSHEFDEYACKHNDVNENMTNNLSFPKTCQW
jgi:hypothetical protein